MEYKFTVHDVVGFVVRFESTMTLRKLICNLINWYTHLKTGKFEFKLFVEFSKENFKVNVNFFVRNVTNVETLRTGETGLENRLEFAGFEEIILISTEIKKLKELCLALSDYTVHNVVIFVVRFERILLFKT